MKHIIATAHIKGEAPIAQSRQHREPKLGNTEKDGAYEERTWRLKANTNESGIIVLPPFAIKNCITAAAKRLGMKFKGNKTYSNIFKSGIIVTDAAPLGVHRDQVACFRLACPVSGIPGDGKRVERWFPIIHTWETDLVFRIYDLSITKEVFEEHLRSAGIFIGFGSFRVENNGIYGRFSVKSLKWDEVSD